MASAENTRTPTSKAPKRSRTSGWVFILCPLHTSNTNIHTLRLCVSFKYASFYRAVSNRSSRCLDRCFCSFRSQNSIDYKTLELNYFVFETFYLLPFLASVSRPQGSFDLYFDLYLNTAYTQYTTFISLFGEKTSPFSFPSACNNFRMRVLQIIFSVNNHKT